MLKNKIMNRLHKNAVEMFSKYIKENDSEKLSLLLKEIESTPEIMHREHLTGHITASGLVVKKGKVLVIWHNFLQRYLQPGGHVDDTDESIFDAAKREVTEETGLNVTVHPLFGENPINIEIQDFPNRPERDEPDHKHYDCIFVFEVFGDSEVTLQKEEVSQFEWLDMNYNFNEGTLKESVKKFLKQS